MEGWNTEDSQPRYLGLSLITLIAIYWPPLCLISFPLSGKAFGMFVCPTILSIHKPLECVNKLVASTSPRA